MVRCRPMNAKEKDRGNCDLRKGVIALLKSIVRTTRSIFWRKTQKSLPKPSLSMPSLGLTLLKVSSTNKAHLPLSSQFSTDTTGLFLPMVRLVVVKLTRWWVEMTPRKAEASFLGLLVKSLPLLKMIQARPILLDVVSSKSTTKKFMTFWVRISRLEWSLSKVLIRESL